MRSGSNGLRRCCSIALRVGAWLLRQNSSFSSCCATLQPSGRANELLPQRRGAQTNEDNARLRPNADHQSSADERVSSVLADAFPVHQEDDVLVVHFDCDMIDRSRVGLNSRDLGELHQRVALTVAVPAQLHAALSTDAQ